MSHQGSRKLLYGAALITLGVAAHVATGGVATAAAGAATAVGVRRLLTRLFDIGGELPSRLPDVGIHFALDGYLESTETEPGDKVAHLNHHVALLVGHAVIGVLKENADDPRCQESKRTIQSLIDLGPDEWRKLVLSKDLPLGEVNIAPMLENASNTGAFGSFSDEDQWNKWLGSFAALSNHSLDPIARKYLSQQLCLHVLYKIHELFKADADPARGPARGAAYAAIHLFMLSRLGYRLNAIGTEVQDLASEVRAFHQEWQRYSADVKHGLTDDERFALKVILDQTIEVEIGLNQIGVKLEYIEEANAKRHKEVMTAIENRLQVPPSLVKATEIPKRPLHFLSRPDLLGRLETMLGRDVQFQRSSTAIIYGPSGFGKTQLAAELYRRWPGPKEWCEADRGEPPVSTINSDTLLIVDRLDEVSKRLSTALPWLRTCDASVVAVTSQRQAADTVLSMRGCATDCDDRIQIVPGFTTKDVDGFLDNGALTCEMAKAISARTRELINNIIHGCPLLWQLVAELICENSLNRVYNATANADDEKEMRRQIFRAWFELYDERHAFPNSRNRTLEIAQFLSTVSLLGSDSDAIGYVLEAPPSEVEEATRPLQRLGLVSVVGMCSKALTPHSLLREACKAIPLQINRDKLKARYCRYLEERLAHDSSSSADFVTMADAWVLCMRGAFVTAARGGNRITPDRVSAFDKSYGGLVKRLEGIAQRCCAGGGMPTRWLTEFFRGFFQDNRNCREIIPLAELVAELPQKSSIFGDITWLGSRVMPEPDPRKTMNDPWMLGMCIRSAVIHWSQQDASIKATAIAKIRAKLDECLTENLPNQSRDLENRETEICAALGGLCLLGLGGEAARALDVRIGSQLPAAHLALILWAVDHDEVVNVRETLSQRWNMLPGGGEKIIVERYLVRRGFDVPRTPVGDQVFNPTRLIIHARLAHAATFEKYVQELCEKGKPYEHNKNGMVLENF